VVSSSREVEDREGVAEAEKAVVSSKFAACSVARSPGLRIAGSTHIAMSTSIAFTRARA
jgi:hypothetical protein